MKKTRDSPFLNDFGPLIRRKRLASKQRISQDDLAARLQLKGITLDRSAVSRIENQERGILDYELMAIFECLKIRPSELLKDT